MTPLPPSSATPSDGINDPLIWQARLLSLRSEVHDIAGALTGIHMVLAAWLDDPKLPESFREDLSLMVKTAERSHRYIEQMRALYLPEWSGPILDEARYGEALLKAVANAFAPDIRLQGPERLSLPDAEMDGEELRDMCLLLTLWSLQVFPQSRVCHWQQIATPQRVFWQWDWEDAQGVRAGVEGEHPAAQARLEAWLEAQGVRAEFDVEGASVSWDFPVK